MACCAINSDCRRRGSRACESNARENAMAYYPRQHITTQFPGYAYHTDFIYNDMVELTAVELHQTRHE